MNNNNNQQLRLFNEGLLYCALKVLLKDLKMDTGTASDPDDRDSDAFMEEDFPIRKEPFKSPDEVLEYWNQCFEKDMLTNLHFREWWRQKVPKVFSPKANMNCLQPYDHIEEEDVHNYFFNVLEKFLCNGEPQQVFASLSSLKDPPSQCGKVFKLGEVTYSCRDCAMDPTCVLCVHCFKNSEHGSHRYKMSTSSGGGYCDCGDPEAWKDSAYCKVHVLGTMNAAADPLSKVPKDIQKRARLVFSTVIKFAHELLTLDNFMKLPGDLQLKDRDNVDPLDDLLEVEDLYVTVLCNDELHTFEEVITTLQRAVDNCDRDLAIKYVNFIDRDGRGALKCGPFQTCSEVKRIIERQTGRRGIKPLKVLVVHAAVWAQQVFSLRLVTWLDSVLGYSEGFRAIFSSIMTEQEKQSTSWRQPCLLQSFLRSEAILWKLARTNIHHLLITGMLMENASKKEFASVFANNYGQVMKEFINDDHDHSFSVTSLSVQLFTVPSIAHHLIANHDIFATLLRTFQSECERKKNAKGKLEFERNSGTPTFRRANFILIDLKYLLSVPPPTLCDNARRGFLHGFSELLAVLGWMQGMDSHTRQVNQHIEFESDWENGFNLHIKLAPVMEQLFDWASRDKVIFLKAYRMLIKKLKEEMKEDTLDNLLELQGYETKGVTFSVSSQAVSFHLPLCRLLAGLSLNLQQYSMAWKEDDFKLTAEEMPPISQILELPLRSLVLVSQVYAGMWRRNGFSLQHQIFFYHSARCRGEMYDRDIQLVQFCAANMDPNSFMLQILDKYGLLHWAEKNFAVGEDESTKHLTSLVEECLAFLVTILGTRHTVGVGRVSQEDVVRKEVIQLLCVEPMAHSALDRALPEDINHETGLEEVIDKVASFKKPANTAAPTKGVYELKEQYYCEYDVFFYHYTREDQSKSEEAQEKRLKALSKPPVCPPPKLPGFSKTFARITEVFQCDLSLHLMKLVLDRADDLKSRCFSESQVHKVLYLIGMALNEEERMEKDPDPVLDGDQDQSQRKFSSEALKVGLLDAMETLVSSVRIESHKELLAWTVDKFRKIAGLKKRDGSKDGSAEPEAAGDEEEKKRLLAAERRKRIMANMAKQQNTFMSENKKLFQDTPSGLREKRVSTGDWHNHSQQNSENSTVCLGPKRSPPDLSVPLPSSYTCILCQEEESLTPAANTLVMAAFLQKSTVLSRVRNVGSRATSDAPAAVFPLLKSTLSTAPHTSSCGHVMHSSCYNKFFEDVAEGEKRRYRSRHPNSFDVEKQEFLCPLCRTLSNSVIPLIPQYHLLQQPGSEKYNLKDVSDEKEAMDAEDGAFEETVEEDRADQTALTSTVVSLVSPLEPSVSKPSSPTPSDSSSSSSSTELASAHSLSSDSTFISAVSESPNCPVVKTSHTDPPITIDFSQWLQALFIALSHRELLPHVVPEPMVTEEGEQSSSAVEQREPLPRFTTCSLDKVVSELESLHHDGTSFGRLFRMVEDGCELVFPPSVYEIMNSFSQTTCKVGLEGMSQLQGDSLVLDERIPLLVWDSCAFTVLSIVVSNMEAEKALFSLSSRQSDCLSALVRFCGVVGSNFGEPRVIQSHSLQLLSILLERDPSNPSIFEVDMFGVLVCLTFSLPSLFNGEGPAALPSCNIQDLHILRLLFTAHLVQLLHTVEVSKLSPLPEGVQCPPAAHCLPINDLLLLVQGGGPESASADSRSLWNHLTTESLSFLRACALFYHFLSCVPAPPELKELGMEPEEEFLVLATYLGLPTSPTMLVNSPFTTELVKKWLEHKPVQANLYPSNYTLSVPQLIPLPEDYSELINRVSDFSCPSSGEEQESKIPSLCLVCGTVLCSQSYCCQQEIGGTSVGACTAHSHVCGAGVGLFLRVRECKVVMFSNANKGCYTSPPFIDQYGETDQGLRRGNPLTLCKERYTRIQRLWINHSMPEEVTNSMESTQGFPVTDWIHL